MGNFDALEKGRRKMFLFSTVLLIALLGSADALDNSCIAIYGYSSCAYFKRAECWANSLPKPEWSVAVGGGTRPEYHERLAKLKALHPSIDKSHRTSPMVMRGCEEPKYVGGSDDFIRMLKEEGIKQPKGC